MLAFIVYGWLLKDRFCNTHFQTSQTADTRTPEQKETLQKQLERLQADYPDARVVGHRDLPGVRKDCPCFEV